MIETNKDDIFEDYTIIEEIGEGGCAKVYLAQKKDDMSEVAVKMIDKINVSDKEMSYIQNEILIMNNIDHPNVIKMLDCYETSENYFIVLEYMRGGELFERIIDKDHFSEQEAADVLKTLVDAINYCHSKGIIHRDLKPENILYESEEEESLLKIADFGVSKIVNNSNDLLSTVIGSGNYVAPEVLKGFKYTSKCDIYALGNIFYIILCGYPPFEENEKAKSKINFPSPDWDDISGEAKDLIEKMMMLDPKKRASLKEMYEHEFFQKSDFSKKRLDIQKKLNNYLKRRKLKATQFAVYYLSMMKKKL